MSFFLGTEEPPVLYFISYGIRTVGIKERAKVFFLRKNKNTLEKILIPNDPDKSPEVLGDFVQVSKSRYYQVR